MGVTLIQEFLFGFKWTIPNSPKNQLTIKTINQINKKIKKITNERVCIMRQYDQYHKSNICLISLNNIELLKQKYHKDIKSSNEELLNVYLYKSTFWINPKFCCQKSWNIEKYNLRDDDKIMSYIYFFEDGLCDIKCQNFKCFKFDSAFIPKSNSIKMSISQPILENNLISIKEKEIKKTEHLVKLMKNYDFGYGSLIKIVDLFYNIPLIYYDLPNEIQIKILEEYWLIDWYNVQYISY